MKKFNTSFSGYSKKEVNDFLAEVIREYEELLNKLKASDQRCLELEKESVKYKSLEATFNRAILIAEESTSNIRRAAFDESKLIVEDAKKNASRIVNNALLRAEKIEEESESLRRKVFVFKKRFRNMVEEHLDEIERFDDRV